MNGVMKDIKDSVFLLYLAELLLRNYSVSRGQLLASSPETTVYGRISIAARCPT